MGNNVKNKEELLSLIIQGKRLAQKPISEIDSAGQVQLPGALFIECASRDGGMLSLALFGIGGFGKGKVRLLLSAPEEASLLSDEKPFFGWFYPLLYKEEINFLKENGVDSAEDLANGFPLEVVWKSWHLDNQNARLMSVDINKTSHPDELKAYLQYMSFKTPLEPQFKWPTTISIER